MARKPANIEDEAEEPAIEIVETPEDVAPEPEPKVPAPPPEDDVGDPTEALRRQLEAHKAETEAHRQRAEAEARRAQDYQAQLTQRTEFSEHKASLSKAYTEDEGKLAAAKRSYAQALKDGDYDSAAEHQAGISQSVALMTQYSSAYQNLEAQEKAPPPRREETREADPFEARLKGMEPRVASWARSHKDDLFDPAMAEEAIEAATMAERMGMIPGSKRYIAYLDEAMGYSTSDDNDPPARQDPAPKPAPSRRAPAAPSGKSAGTSGRQKVYLTEADRASARTLGMTDEEYAPYVAKYRGTNAGMDGIRFKPSHGRK